MKKNKSLLAAISFLALSFGLCSTANAISVSFTGTFSQDDDVALFSFTLDAASTVTIHSFGYAGGTQADSNIVANGGFDTMLHVYDDAGVFVGTNDDGGIGVVNADPVNGESYDALLDIALSAGNYTVALTQYDNLPAGNLSDGFTQTGNPFFTSVFGGCSNGQFCDSVGNNRTNAWAVDINNVASAVPIPAAVWLLGSGLLGLIGFAKRKVSLFA